MTFGQFRTTRFAFWTLQTLWVGVGLVVLNCPKVTLGGTRMSTPKSKVDSANTSGTQALNTGKKKMGYNSARVALKTQNPNVIHKKKAQKKTQIMLHSTAKERIGAGERAVPSTSPHHSCELEKNVPSSAHNKSGYFGRQIFLKKKSEAEVPNHALRTPHTERTAPNPTCTLS